MSSYHPGSQGPGWQVEPPGLANGEPGTRDPLMVWDGTKDQQHYAGPAQIIVDNCNQPWTSRVVWAVSGRQLRQLRQCGKFLHLHNVTGRPTTYLGSTNPDTWMGLTLDPTSSPPYQGCKTYGHMQRHFGGSILVKEQIVWSKVVLGAALPPTGAAYILVSLEMST